MNPILSDVLSDCYSFLKSKAMILSPKPFYPVVHGFHELFFGKAGISCSQDQITRQFFTLAARIKPVLISAAVVDRACLSLRCVEYLPG